MKMVLLWFYRIAVSVGLFTFRGIFRCMENMLICFVAKRDDDKMRKSNFSLKLSLTLNLEDLFQSVR